MYVTPLEVKMQRFDRSVRGYRPDEVHRFLEMVADDIEQLLRERVELERQLSTLEVEVAEKRDMESSFRDAMLLASEAQELGRQRAESILADAEAKARQIISDAEDERRELLSSVEDQRNELAFEIDSLERQERDLLSRLRDFLDEQNQIIEDFESSTPSATKPASNGEARLVAIPTPGARLPAARTAEAS